MSSVKVDLRKVESLEAGALADGARLKALLSQLYPDQTRSIYLLCTLLENGFVAQLKSVLASHSGKLPQSELTRLSQGICDQCGFEISRVNEALSCWAQVLASAKVTFGDKVDLRAIEAYDSSLLSDAKRLEAALSDAFPNDVRGRNAVCSLLRNGLVEQLKRRAAANGQVTSGEIDNLSQTAEDKFCMSPAIAAQALRDWCGLLNIMVQEIEPLPSWQGREPIVSVTQPDPQPLSLSRPASSLQPSSTSGPASSPELMVVTYRPPISLNLPDNVSLELIWCPPGTFMMGSPENELGRSDDEQQHQVTLTQGFYLGKYPVTQEQYRAVIGRNPSHFSSFLSKDSTQRPVEQVSWNLAQEFCEKITSICDSHLPNGYKFVLPSEAQWEYACRAGTTSALNSGQNLTSSEGACGNVDKVAWYDANSGLFYILCCKTHPVGQKQANAWGFYDMHGNVWEWCSDWLASYPEGEAIDPLGPSCGMYRVLRGGSWGRFARYCRSAYRFSSKPVSSLGNIGFRLAATPVESYVVSPFC